MQRTVHGTKITFAKVTIDGANVRTVIDSTIVDIKDTATAIKSFVKKHPTFAVVKTEPISKLYILDDEIFFKYAREAKPEETTEETPEETTAQ